MKLIAISFLKVLTITKEGFNMISAVDMGNSIPCLPVEFCKRGEWYGSDMVSQVILYTYSKRCYQFWSFCDYKSKENDHSRTWQALANR